MKRYFYQVEFLDGRVIRRAGVSKKEAEAAYITFTGEMFLLNVESVSWGVLE